MILTWVLVISSPCGCLAFYTKQNQALSCQFFTFKLYFVQLANIDLCHFKDLMGFVSQPNPRTGGLRTSLKSVQTLPLPITPLRFGLSSLWPGLRLLFSADRVCPVRRANKIGRSHSWLRPIISIITLLLCSRGFTCFFL